MTTGWTRRLWPRSLKGQMLLALALALLLAQGISTALLYRVGEERRRETLVHNAAFRLLNASQPFAEGTAPPPGGPNGESTGPPQIRAEECASFTPGPADQRWPDAEQQLRRILADQDMPIAAIRVVARPVAADPVTRARLARRAALFSRDPPPTPDHVLLAAIEPRPGGKWLVVRVQFPPSGAGPRFLASLIAQTLMIYLVLVGAMALILRHITRPLVALTARLDHFAENRDADGRLEPQGPDDMRRLIEAHNTMEARIIALLDEKDVMLGAIGHDLKTPLSALRVRIESVEDDAERAKMAGTIEDIVRSLDDILSLARVGRPTDPREPTELSALVASVAEEYEDMGDPVELGDTTRIVLPLRATWLRRALRNLIGNALRYGGKARVSLALAPGAGVPKGWAVIRIEDEGRGIPEGDIARMLEPFTRGEPSRNSETGGAGLGLTLARAIAEQHGGMLALTNRRGADGSVCGLSAVLRLPVE